jgi:hypothetical protein
LQTFETEMLAEDANFGGVGRLNRALIGKAEAMDSGYRTVRDMDFTEITVYGEQEQSAYNGHFESTTGRSRTCSSGWSKRVGAWCNMPAMIGCCWRRFI